MDAKQINRVLREPIIAVTAAFEPPETQKKYNDLASQLDTLARGDRIKPKSLIGVVKVIQEQIEGVGYLDPRDAETFKATLIRQVRDHMGSGPRPIEREPQQVEETKVVSTKRKHKKN